MSSPTLSAPRVFVTTTTGLRRDLPPMRLFEKAKRYGVWNPSALDFRQDRADWQRLVPLEQEVLLHLTSLFQAGEEAVTADLLPLLLAISREGRLEEEMYLTSFLFEEAKHTDFFRRFLDEVAGAHQDLSQYHAPNYRAIVYEALPAAMLGLLADPSPAAQVRAATTYNLIVEGVLAETGYHAYFTVLDQQGILPGQREGIALLKQDESRHIAYGVYLISRLLAEEPALWQVCEDTMNELLPAALGVVADTFGHYPVMPFGLEESVFTAFPPRPHSGRGGKKQFLGVWRRIAPPNPHPADSASPSWAKSAKMWVKVSKLGGGKARQAKQASPQFGGQRGSAPESLSDDPEHDFGRMDLLR